MRKMLRYLFMLICLFTAIVSSSFFGQTGSFSKQDEQMMYPVMDSKPPIQNAEERKKNEIEGLAAPDNYKSSNSGPDNNSCKMNDFDTDESIPLETSPIEINITSLPGAKDIPAVDLSELPDDIVNGAIGISISWVDSKTAYLLKKSGPAAGQMFSWLYKTSDGKMWTLVMELAPVIHNYPKEIFFWSVNSGILLTDYHGYDDYINLTEDGGEHWRSLHVNLRNQLGSYSYLEGEEASIDDSGNICVELSAHYENGDVRSMCIPLTDFA